MKLLLIEDEISIINFLKPNLEAEFFSVDVAQDGEKGSWLARTNHYDLILLDYMLPSLNGPEVCREIRQDKKHVPIIMTTIRPELETKLEMFDLGVDDYLNKPFILSELLARIKAILRRPNQIRPSLVKIDNLQVNYDNYTVKRGRNNIYLTKKEFELLRYLLHNKGITKSRTEIMEEVWDMNADPFSNTVESHVLNLRRKIDNKNNRKLIHTVPGRGYKIDENLFSI